MSVYSQSTIDPDSLLVNVLLKFGLIIVAIATITLVIINVIKPSSILCVGFKT